MTCLGCDVVGCGGRCGTTPPSRVWRRVGARVLRLRVVRGRSAWRAGWWQPVPMTFDLPF
jgi:hypothetical protein